ncbi:hypothetical protein [Phormidesmis priestleyi]
MKRVSLAALIVLCVSGLLVFPRSVYSIQRYAQYIQKPSVISECPDFITQASSANTTQIIHPTEVIVKPWRGRHHVYGVFVLPPGYEATDFFQISLEDGGSYCGKVAGLDNLVPDPSVDSSDLSFWKLQSDRVVVLGRLRTRTALWLISKGKNGQLNHPQNWSLQIEKAT